MPGAKRASGRPVELILLEDQDRSRWDAARIAEGQALIERALGLGRPGPYQVQAAIASLHDDGGHRGRHGLGADRVAVRLAAADEPIAGRRAQPRGRRRDARWTGDRTGDDRRDHADRGVLDGYSYFHAARADLLRRLERWSEAAGAYRRALELTTNGPERAFLTGRLDAVDARAASEQPGRSRSLS